MNITSVPGLEAHWLKRLGIFLELSGNSYKNLLWLVNNKHYLTADKPTKQPPRLLLPFVSHLSVKGPSCESGKKVWLAENIALGL
jgi:hypothetical protein